MMAIDEDFYTELALFNGEQTTLYEDNLKRVLSPIGDKPILLISIYGPRKTGKSFLANLILRAFEKAAVGEDDLLGWDTPNESLHGFPLEWERSHHAFGHDEVDSLSPGKTAALLISTRPIMLTSVIDKQREVAVLLVDIQTASSNCYDQVQVDRALLRVCLEFSSLVVLNFREELDQQLVTLLEDLLTEEHKCKRICFVVRDCVEEVTRFGEGDGKNYLQQHLPSTILPKLEKTECFFLPSPGPKVHEPGYNGNIAGMVPKFTDSLEHLLLHLTQTPLHGLHLTTAENLYQRFQLWGKALQADDESCETVEDQLMQFCLQIVESYRKSFQIELEGCDHQDSTSKLELHSRLKKGAMDQFLHSEIQANVRLVTKHTELLASNLDDAFEGIQKASKVTIDEELGICKKMYEDEIEQILENRRIYIREATIKNKEIEGKVTQHLAQIMSNQSATKIHESQRRFQTQCQLIFNRKWDEKWETEEKRRAKFRKEFEQVKFRAEKEYTKMFRIRTAKDTYRALQMVHSQISQHVVSTTRVPGLDETDKRYFKKELVEVLSNTFAKLRSEQKDKKRFLDNAIEFYQKTMEPMKERLDQQFVTSESRSKTLAMELFVASHQNAKQEAIEWLRQKCGGLDEGVRKQLCDRIEQSHHDYVKEIEDGKHRRMTPLEVTLARYTEEMGRLIHESSSIELPNSEDVESFHQQVVQKVVQENVELDSDVKDQLVLKVAGELDEIKRKVKKDMDEAKSAADSLVKEAVDSYKKEITSIQCDSLSGLYMSQETALSLVLEQFEEKCKVKDQEFVTTCLEQIKTAAAIICRDQVRVLQAKLEQGEALLQAKLVEARSIYNKLMAQHFEKTKFQSLVDFSRTHYIILTQITAKVGKNLNPVQFSRVNVALKPLYEKYKERNLLNTPGNLAIGIDLGTTYSCIAVYQDEGVKVIPSPSGSNTVPSYVAFTTAGEIVGEPAKNQAHETPKETIFDVKRLIGRKIDDAEVKQDVELWPFKVVGKGKAQKPVIVVNGDEKEPELVSAKVLAHLKEMAENYLQTTVEKAVITVPAYFNDGQRQATIDAGEIAGLQVLQVLNEPTAAAVAYHLHHANATKMEAGKPTIILVYDLGGGTFDVSVLRIIGDEIKVLAVNGDTHLGGEDFDHELVQSCINKFRDKTGIRLTNNLHHNFVDEWVHHHRVDHRNDCMTGLGEQE